MSVSAIITGGAGFIGSNLVHHLIHQEKFQKVVVLDKLTYAGNMDNLESVLQDPRFHFVQGDICDNEVTEKLFQEVQPQVVFHLAAESHVDRSIDDPSEFVQTNVVGTFQMLESARQYWMKLENSAKKDFRFIHVSTDEVFGSLGETDFFREDTPYAPNSPYSASKAGADHLARSYFHTYHFPVITTNCSNNYGPFHFPEKLIPLVILNALDGKALPIYGDGKNIRDWLFVSDHCIALQCAFEKGKPGETYNIGGHNERTNLQVVQAICDALDQLVPKSQSYREQISFVKDRPGHDRRYAIDPTKIQSELGFKSKTSFEDGIVKTIQWYLEHKNWCDRITNGVYRRERLGAGS